MRDRDFWFLGLMDEIKQDLTNELKFELLEHIDLPNSVRMFVSRLQKKSWRKKDVAVEGIAVIDNRWSIKKKSLIRWGLGC